MEQASDQGLGASLTSAEVVSSGPDRSRHGSAIRIGAIVIGATAAVAVLVASYFLGVLDDAMVRGGDAPVRRGLYWVAGAALCMALVALIVIVAMIIVRSARKERASATSETDLQLPGHGAL